MKEKPIVRCYRVGGYPTIGVGTLIVPINHPQTQLNGILCWTSAIEKIEVNGFETKNTIYIIEEKQ